MGLYVLIEPTLSALLCQSPRKMCRYETPILVAVFGHELHQEFVLLEGRSCLEGSELPPDKFEKTQ